MIFSEGSGWKPIGTAPIEQDVQLIVTYGGKPYLLEAVSPQPEEKMTSRRFPPPRAAAEIAGHLNKSS
jgi:hypothetical protein